MEPVAALEKLSLADRAAMQLRQLIVDASLLPGQRLTEQVLSDELQVARGTVRPALAKLVSENLVVRRPYSGWAVQEVDAELLRENYQVRGAFEELSARLLAMSMNKTKRAVLMAAYERMVIAEKGGGIEDRLRADIGFHSVMIRESGNKLLVRQYESLSGQIEWLYRWSEKNWPRRINLIDWHKPILDAVLDGDADAAVSAVRVHTQRSLQDDMHDLHNQTYCQSHE